MDAVATAARAIKAGEADLLIAGGVESMSRAPFVMGKASEPFARTPQLFDTTLGWRFINPALKAAFGVDTMPETGENVATQFNISRADQDAFALRSQTRAGAAQESGRFAREIVPVSVPRGKLEPVVVSRDEHPRATSLAQLAKLPTPFQKDGTVTAGNSSGLNDGACALIIASESAVERFHLTPRARIVATATAGVEPRIMGMGPVPAVHKALARARVELSRVGVIELNEAFASQALAVLRQLGIADDDPRVNPNGGAIALGHPLGMSGARLVLTASLQLGLQPSEQRFAVCTMCIGVGQGIAMVLERV
jgi:3-oxoadipyl-CoA thiolase